MYVNNSEIFDVQTDTACAVRLEHTWTLTFFYSVTLNALPGFCEVIFITLSHHQIKYS